MTILQAELLMAAVIMARSTSYIFNKIGLVTMTLLAIRFLLAFAVLLCIFHRHFRKVTRGAIIRGMLLGLSLTSVMVTELTGMKTTPASVTAFIENTAIIFVPLFLAVLERRRPTSSVIISSCIILLGVGLLTLNGGTFELQTGLIFCFLSAICYAGFFILTGHFAGKDDPLVLGSLEIAFVGVFCTIGALLVETPQLPTTPMEWEIIAALVLVCSVFGFTFQPVAQRYIPAERAGLFCALSPLCAAIMGCAFLGETLGTVGIVGGTLIIAGILYHNGHELLKQISVSLHHVGMLKKV